MCASMHAASAAAHPAAAHGARVECGELSVILLGSAVRKMCVCLCLCVCVCARALASVWFAFIYVYLYIYINIHIHIYIYTYLHRDARKFRVVGYSNPRHAAAAGRKVARKMPKPQLHRGREPGKKV